MTLYTYQAVEDSLRAHAADQSRAQELEEAIEDCRMDEERLARLIVSELANDEEGKLAMLIGSRQWTLVDQMVDELCRQFVEDPVDDVRTEDEE